MDHLPVPIDAIIRPPFQVPYLCTHRFSYDDWGFLTYPHRVGIDFQQICDRDLFSAEVAAPFIQAWLWFGLLGETLGIGSRKSVPQRVASFSSFMETLPSGKIILTTKEMKQAVARACGKYRSPASSEFHRTRFDSCLAVASDAVNRILTTPTCQTQMAQAKIFSDLSPLYLILLSVQLLIESLGSYRNILFSTDTRQRLPKPPRLEHQADLFDILLREAGFCPYELFRCQADLQMKYFLSLTLRHGRNKHVGCSRLVCSRESIDEEAIFPHHSSPDCLCEMVSAADTTVKNIVDKGEAPLLNFIEASGGKRQLQIKRIQLPLGDKCTPFIAISHVRSLGLGNASRNSLPYCQLSFLQVLANNVVRSSPEPVAFWIDTMCLPLERGLRKQALRHVHQVFEVADAVVVLDPSLLNAKVGSELDCILRIRYSGWKRRLWTLQEGALANKLWFKFSNLTCELSGVLEGFERSAQFPILIRYRELTQPEGRKLLAGLAALDHDLKSVNESTDSGVLTATIDRTKLYTVLRLGYLGVTRFRYFREDKEHAQMGTVLQILEQAYCGDEARHAVTIAPTLERLQEMCSVELLQ